MRSLSASRGRSRRKSLSDFVSCENRVHVNANGVFNAARVAASERCRDGNAAPLRFLEDAAVAPFQSGLRQRQSAKLIFAVRVGTAHVKKNFGLTFIQRLLHGRNQSAEIFLV